MAERRSLATWLFDAMDAAAGVAMSLLEHATVYLTAAIAVLVPVAIGAQALVYLRTGTLPVSICDLHRAIGIAPEAATLACFRPATNWHGFNEIVGWATTQAPAFAVIIGLAVIVFATGLALGALLHNVLER